jgi:hypothetical protein
MINGALRERLENFICEHENGCQDERCMLRAAEEWVDEMEARGYPKKEMILLGLAFQAYLTRDRQARAKLTSYEAAISNFVTKRAEAKLAPVLTLVR